MEYDSDQIPSFFICPISLEVMKDPVTLSTGMTFDRESIHRWLFVYGRTTCPITKQPLLDLSLTPNSTLLRLIHQWHATHSSSSSSSSSSSKHANIVPRTNSTSNITIPTFDPSILPKLIQEVKQHETPIKSLKRIKSLITENDANRRCMEEAGLLLVISSFISEILLFIPQRLCSNYYSLMMPIEEALNILHLLKPPPDVLKKVAEDREGELIRALAAILQRGSYQSRFVSTLLLKSVFMVVDPKYKSELDLEFFDAVVEILKDQNSSTRATMGALSILIEVIAPNLVKAVEAGVVGVLIELLAESEERRSNELMLGVLEMVCSRAEGRSEFASHAAGVAVVVGKILTVSAAASELGVKVLWHVCGLSAREAVVKEMAEVGGVVRLCMVVQAECSRKTKERAERILGLHFKAWSKSPCFPNLVTFT
ncbi:hypothetical protein H6P81_005581 [Aristolochia fimbriata]|uniref:U-box domain-containing protein n=1 Tax=Aristolochia fimbriata TaxID=158543 RepID=A0AAV7EUZ9_ARIFI|nr:hypothetical protein H6P81_005581 [Aristolochia fimbriata]